MNANSEFDPPHALITTVASALARFRKSGGFAANLPQRRPCLKSLFQNV